MTHRFRMNAAAAMATVALSLPSGAGASTLDTIKARGKLVCPVPTAPYLRKDNVDAMVADAGASAEVKYLLGVTPGVGQGLGLSDTWARDVVKAYGNYGDIYAETLGDKSPFKLPAGQNQPWTKGGLLFSPVFD